MQNFDIDQIFKRLKEEMVSAWAYLDALKQIYENEDNKHIDTLLETAPGFFSLIESSLMESAFSRLARLMDPKRSCGEDNLSFAMLCEHCEAQDEFKTICEDISKIMFEWKKGKYNTLRTYRNKFHSHNDLSRLGNAQPLISTRMSSEEFGLLKELFENLWCVIKHLNSRIKNSALLDPAYTNLNLRPGSFLLYLKTGLKISKLLPDHPELCSFIHNDGE